MVLRERGFKVWYDNNMADLTKAAMARGVQKSEFVILFLSQGVLTRPFVQLEVETALKAGKRILLVHEADPRHSPFDFNKEVIRKQQRSSKI